MALLKQYYQILILFKEKLKTDIKFQRGIVPKISNHFVLLQQLQQPDKSMIAHIINAPIRFSEIITVINSNEVEIILSMLTHIHDSKPLIMQSQWRPANCYKLEEAIQAAYQGSPRLSQEQ